MSAAETLVCDDEKETPEICKETKSLCPTRSLRFIKGGRFILDSEL